MLLGGFHGRGETLLNYSIFYSTSPRQNTVQHVLNQDSAKATGPPPFAMDELLHDKTRPYCPNSFSRMEFDHVQPRANVRVSKSNRRY